MNWCNPTSGDCEWHTHLLYDFVCPGTLNSEALLHHFSSNCIQDLHHTKIHSIIDIRTITYKYIYILYHFSQQFLVKHLSTNLLMISLKNLSDFRSSPPGSQHPKAPLFACPSGIQQRSRHGGWCLNLRFRWKYVSKLKHFPKYKDVQGENSDEDLWNHRP